MKRIIDFTAFAQKSSLNCYKKRRVKLAFYDTDY